MSKNIFSLGIEHDNNGGNTDASGTNWLQFLLVRTFDMHAVLHHEEDVLWFR